MKKGSKYCRSVVVSYQPALFDAKLGIYRNMVLTIIFDVFVG